MGRSFDQRVGTGHANQARDAAILRKRGGRTVVGEEHQSDANFSI